MPIQKKAQENEHSGEQEAKGNTERPNSQILPTNRGLEINSTEMNHHVVGNNIPIFFIFDGIGDGNPDNIA
ncbi:MAG TPA: hypothetical protein VK543_10255 [Puia sp.]|nr:hypothetical protein [Puia sp.]